MPAALLYRRPDVAVVERFPKISLTGGGGSSSVSTGNFTEWASQYYTLGPTVSLPLFIGGRVKSGILLSKAKRDEALANHQKVTLSAFADVES